MWDPNRGLPHRGRLKNRVFFFCLSVFSPHGLLTTYDLMSEEDHPKSLQTEYAEYGIHTYCLQIKRADHDHIGPSGHLRTWYPRTTDRHYCPTPYYYCQRARASSHSWWTDPFMSWSIAISIIADEGNADCCLPPWSPADISRWSTEYIIWVWVWV